MPRLPNTPIFVLNFPIEQCSKCEAIVPEKYLSYSSVDELWVECIHTGWYCPEHSPTMNCDDDDCECCNPEEDEE
jgi:hypothetical protein